MQREDRAIKPLVTGAVIFLTLGIAIANETLSRFGLEGNYLLVFSVAFILAAILLSRNILMLGVILSGVVAINLPDASLLRYGLDRDVLLAAVCALILVPSIYELITK